MKGFGRFALRDAILLAIALGAWWLLAARSAGDGFVADFSGFVAGGLLGVVAFLLHEWGHVLGGLATGSVMRAAGPLSSGYLFSFDTKQNSLAQFLVMSVGGFLVTGAIVWAYHVFLPDGLLATRVARGSVLFLAFLGIVLEFPLVGVALYRRGVPREAAVKLASPPSAA